MKNKFPIICLLVGVATSLHAAPLSESTFTEVIKEVNVVAPTTKSTTAAKVNQPFKAPDLVRTGRESRAEMTAPDQTITRVGANTVFSFEPAGRTLNLEQGSVLFHPPAGTGGGTIKSRGVSAAVLGTTLIASATTGGGFKVILLEGKGKVTLANGKSVTLKAGQMVFVQPGGTSFSPVLDINLEKLVANSQLMNGFPHELSSMPLIRAAIDTQKSMIASGKASDTGVSANAYADSPAEKNGFKTIDHGTYQIAGHVPLTKEQVEVLINSGLQQHGSPGGRSFSPSDL